MRHTNAPERLIVIGRTLACVLLLVTWAFDGGMTNHPPAMFAGGAIYIALTVAWAVWARMRSGMDVTRMLGITVGIDAIALALLSASTRAAGDPFYPWYVAEAVFFALSQKRRQAWVFGALLASSHMVGQAFRGNVASTSDLVFLLASSFALVMLGYFVSVVLGDQEQRRREMEEQRAEVEALNARLERSMGELRAVTEITELIHSTLEVETIGPVLLDILEKVIDIPTASLYVIDKDKQETLFSTSSVRPGPGRSFSGYDIAGPPSTAEATGAFSCIELVEHDNTSVIFCAEEPTMAGLRQEDRVVLQAVASELVVAVENSRLYRLTKRLSITDELTDLYNYRFLQQRLDDEIHRAERYDKRLSFLMLDIDDFKRVNDVHGHRVGDQVLAEVSALLKSTVREVDVVARYGGEEFSVILPETDAPGAFIAAEKIREAVALQRFRDADGEPVVHVTVSIGLASFPSHATDKEALLRAADDAVYHAKATGKDRVRAPRLRVRRSTIGDPIERMAE
ncbi:MAG: diguanylate cyclase [Coriobacteriia bacterium]|nr:diguanylate cyclase [Coriobacteriia bacterium]